jgi:hypoxanthine phosphoribosyltransferase
LNASSHEHLEIYATSGDLATRVSELANALGAQLRAAGSHTRDPLIICPLNGGFVFGTDVCRQLATRHAIELVELVPYSQARRRGATQIAHAFTPALDVHDRDVAVMDGIVDTGFMLRHLVAEIERRGPRSLSLYVLFDRPATRVVDLPLTHVGFDAPSELLVGYGLEHRGRHAQLPDVYRLHAA